MTTKMVPKNGDSTIQSIAHRDGSSTSKGRDGAFDVDDKNVEDARASHGMVERDQAGSK
jgi:hypothetical protein